MGAGASIDDEGDLKKVFEKEKAEGKYTDEQAAKLEAQFNGIKGDPKLDKKGEFYLIGKCRKAYADAGIGESGLVAAAPAPAVAAAPAPAKPFPELPADFVCKAGPHAAQSVPMVGLPAAIEAAQAAGLTALVVDRSTSHAVDTFFSYSSTVLDAKKMQLDVSVQKLEMAEVMERTRKQLLGCLRQDKTLIVACQSCAPDFVGQFDVAACGLDLSGKSYPGAKGEGKSFLPAELLFDKSGKGLLAEAAWEKLFREEEVKEPMGGAGLAFVNPESKFNVVVTTQFNVEDLDDFLFKEGSPALPAGKFQVIWVAHTEGTEAME